MTRPTRPPGAPYPDGEEPVPEQPRFTPHQPGQPPAQHQPAPNEPGPYQPEQPQAARPGLHPYDAPRPGPAGPPQPTFTPHGADGREVRPRPTFTPHEGHFQDRSRPALAPTAFFAPAPAGYPQPSFEPFDYPEVAAPSRQGPRYVPDSGQPDGSTQILERDSVPTGPQRVFDTTSPNLARSSRVMALGTMASRVTGFLRTFVFLAVLGVNTTANAYNTANNLPNTVYYLMLGGIFTSVVVPMLVRAAKEDPDRGEGYAQRIYSFGVLSLLLVTVVATLLAGPIADLYGGDLKGPHERVLMITFAYFFIPQIFFYGMDSLLGAILNVRGRFGPNMWTPVINNVVVITVGVMFFLTVRNGTTAASISGYGVALLGIGTTAGIVIQSICLFPIMWRAGFSMKLTFDFRREEIREIGRMSGWMFGYVVSQFLGNLVAVRVANSAPTANGVSAYSYAYQFFQLPYAIVGISVISALLPRMSGHATDRRYSLVRDDFSKGVRLASVIVVPAAVFLGILGAPLCEFLLAIGHTSWQDARYIGEVFGAFCVGLLPFMFTQLQLRVFYSFHESKTPAIIGMIMLGVGVIGYYTAQAVLPPTQIVVGLAFAYGIMTLVGAAIAWPLLLRRVGSLDGWRITRSLVRMFLATIPGLLFAFVVMGVAGSFLHQGPLYGFVVTVVAGSGALLLYAICCRLLGIEEFRTLMRSIGGRFG